MTIFTRIIKGEIPSYRIAEDDYFLAFLDINPLKEGHTLVIPKTETDHFFDLDENFLSRILVFANPRAHAFNSDRRSGRYGFQETETEINPGTVQEYSGEADKKCANVKMYPAKG